MPQVGRRVLKRQFFCEEPNDPPFIQYIEDCITPLHGSSPHKHICEVCPFAVCSLNHRCRVWFGL